MFNFGQVSAQFNGWEQLPGPFGGNISCATQQGSSWYIGTGTGVFKSMDEGENWQRLAWTPQNQPVTSIVIQTGEIIVSTAGVLLQPNIIDKTSAFVYRSTDEGQTWSVDTIHELQHYSSFNLKVFRHRSVLIASDVNLVAGGSGQLLRSADDGQNWEDATNGAYFEYFDFNDSLLLGDEGLLDIQYSRNGGLSWQNLSAPPGSFWGSYSLGQGNTIFYFGDLEPSYRTTNFGASWQIINIPNGFYQISHCKALPNGKLAAMLDYSDLDNMIFISGNNGLSWQKYGGNPIALAVDIVANGTVYGVATSQGFYKNFSTGNFFNPSNNGITAADVSSQLIHEGLFWAASAEGLYRSWDGGDTWISSFPQSALTHSRDIQLKGDTICAITSTNFFYSTDNGDSWQNPYVSGGWGQEGPFDQANRMAIDGNMVLVGAYDQYLSTDFGANWIFNTMSWNGSGVLAVNGIYFATHFSNGIMRSNAQGNSWQVVHPGVTGKGRLYYLNGKVFACMEYFGLRYSADLGNTWSQATGFPIHGLFNYVNPVKAMAANDTTLFVAIDYAGIFQSKDGAASWTLVSADLPNLRFNDLILENGILYAACSDGGIWKYDLTTVGTYSPATLQTLPIWPNPVGHQGAQTSCPDNKETPIKIMVYNIQGEAVISQSVCCNGGYLPLPLEGLIPGLYRLVMVTKEGTQVGSFVKK